MSAACPVCNRRQDDGIVCHACVCILEYELADEVQGVAALVAELDTTLARQGRGELGGKGGLANERAGFHAGASIAAGALSNTLTTWARDVSGETWEPDLPRVIVARYHANPRYGPFCNQCDHASCQAMRVLIPIDAEHVMVQAAKYLLSEIVAVRRHLASAELHDEIVSSIRQARNAIDRAANRTIIPVGPCPEQDENGQWCPGEVLAYIPTEDDRPSRMECKVDGSHKWTSVQWLRTGKRILDRIEREKREARIFKAVYGEDVA